MPEQPTPLGLPPLPPGAHHRATSIAMGLVEGLTFNHVPNAVPDLARAYLDLLRLLGDQRRITSEIEQLPAV